MITQRIRKLQNVFFLNSNAPLNLMYHALFWSVTSAVRADSVGLFDLVCALSMNILYAYLIHKKYLKKEKGRGRKNKKRKEREGKSK